MTKLYENYSNIIKHNQLLFYNIAVNLIKLSAFVGPNCNKPFSNLSTLLNLFK